MTKPDRAIGAEARKPNFDYLFLFDKPLPPYRSIAQIAKESNKDPLELIIDLALEKHLKQFFIQPIVNEDQDIVLGMMRHPRSVVTFSDSGAHVSQIMDSSIQTHLLGHWVRDRQALTLEYAIRKITFELASFWGLQGRGMIREGNFADVTIFNPDTVSPTMPTLQVRPARRGAPAQAEVGRNQGDDRQRPGTDARERAYGRTAGSADPRSLGRFGSVTQFRCCAKRNGREDIVLPPVAFQSRRHLARPLWTRYPARPSSFRNGSKASSRPRGLSP